MKGECPTCRAPCSLLGINLILSSLIESRFPEEYAKRRAESQSQGNADGRLSVVEDGFLVVIEADSSEYQSFIPGVQTEIKLSSDNTDVNENGFRFLSESGSGRFCLTAGEESDERRFSVIADLITRSHERLSVKVISRCLKTRPLEVNINGGYQMGQFQSVSDDRLDESGSDRIRSVLMDVHGELQKQWRLMGTAGRDRLIRRIETSCPSLLGAQERLFLTSLENRITETYSSFEKTSFLLGFMVLDDPATREYIVSCTNTARRLELILTKLKSRDYVITIDGSSQENSSALLRPTTISSTLILFLIVLLLLALKGLGYLDFPTRTSNRFRI
jgi:hypothetical protein